MYALCKGIQDNLGFWIPLRGFRISWWWISVFVSGTVVGFWIAIVGGIPDSLSCIPDSKAQDLGFKRKFSQILDPTGKTFLDSGMRIPLHQAASSLFPAFRSCGVWPEIRERETITKKEELRERESSHSLPYPLAVFPAHTLWFRLKSERQ